MNKSDGIQELAKALAKAQEKINGVKKTADNPYFKSKYATLEDVVAVVKPALLEQGIVVLQGIQDAEGGVGIETMLLHSSGQWISSTLRLPATKQDAQGYGSAITYGRRYGLMAICGVPAEDDDGNAATAASIKQPVADPALMKHLTDAAGKGVEAFREAWKGLTKEQRESVPQKALADLKAKCEEAVPA